MTNELPHITWCTTGPLAFLPIHAAGQYDRPNEKISDYAISSYTPSLSTLLDHSREPADFRGILAIGQVHTAGHTPLPGTAVELDAIRKQASNQRFTQLDGEKATIAATLEAMEEHSWVHLACHASQNTDDPTKSAFHVHDGALDLGTIRNKSIKNAGLAFLSACQTATGDEGLPEEAVHLAAGMVMAGYPSVIATMWSIHDSDAPLVAENVYKQLLEGAVPDTRKAALALHSAVGCLRDKVGVNAFSRWVPYIHMGV
jgi:CHAT domain-containing protein